MGVEKTIMAAGNGIDKPKAGDTITVSYTGYLYDQARYLPGQQFDTTEGRGDFTTTIGVGSVIQGWDIGILEVGGGMYLGEKVLLVITSNYAYGDQGFPGSIPPGACLLFELHLKAINDLKAQE